MEAIEAGGPPKSVACKRGAGVASCTWVYLSPEKQAEERRDPLPQSPTCQEILLPLGREAYELYGLRAFEFIKCGTWVVPRKIKGLDISAEVFEKNGGPAGTRAPDPLIKSQQLYILTLHKFLLFCQYQANSCDFKVLHVALTFYNYCLLDVYFSRKPTKTLL